MKIYTKTGDKGETSLLGGKRVPKTDAHIEAVGALDELNAWLGLIGDDMHGELQTEVRQVQEILFIIGSHLALDETNQDFKIAAQLPQVTEADIEFLEKSIDSMTAELPPLQNFILPGGDTTVSYCHLARAVARRAERVVVDLFYEVKINIVLIKYLNRLSDYLFTLARKIAKDKNITEIPWQGM